MLLSVHDLFYTGNRYLVIFFMYREAWPPSIIHAPEASEHEDKDEELNADQAGRRNLLKGMAATAGVGLVAASGVEALAQTPGRVKQVKVPEYTPRGVENKELPGRKVVVLELPRDFQNAAMDISSLIVFRLRQRNPDIDVVLSGTPEAEQHKNASVVKFFGSAKVTRHPVPKMPPGQVLKKTGIGLGAAVLQGAMRGRVDVQNPINKGTGANSNAGETGVGIYALDFTLSGGGQDSHLATNIAIKAVFDGARNWEYTTSIGGKEVQLGSGSSAEPYGQELQYIAARYFLDAQPGALDGVLAEVASRPGVPPSQVQQQPRHIRPRN